MGKSQGKRPLGRPRRKLEDIRIHFVERGEGDTDWIVP
jgi:hypothetical protein